MSNSTLTREQVKTFDTYASDSIAIGQLKRTCLAAMDELTDAREEVERLQETEDQLQAEVERLKDYVGDEMLKSDFQTAGQMRAEIERLREFNVSPLEPREGGGGYILRTPRDATIWDTAVAETRRALEGGTDAD
jgi:hypothetical protein